MPYNDLIYAPSGNKTQGDAVILVSYKASGEVVRGHVVDYSGYANTHSGRWLPIAGY